MSTRHRLPRAGIDPIRSDGVALAAVLAAVHLPLRPETIVLLLDRDRCGSAIVVVHGTSEADAVLDVAERVLDQRTRGSEVAAAIIASVRPGTGVELADADRWLELVDVAAQATVELVEWYVIGAGVDRPRRLVDAPVGW